jgi:hypothetical protein
MLKEIKSNSGKDKNIYCIYLAPGQVGKDEVRQVRDHESFRRSHDKAKHVSWKSILDYSPPPKSSYLGDQIAENVILAIRSAIENTGQIKYPDEGDRGIIRNILERACRRVNKHYGPISQNWHGRSEVLRAKNTTVSFSTVVRMKTEKNDVSTIVNFLDENRNINVQLARHLKISEKGKKLHAVKKWWREVTEHKTIQVSTLGTFGMGGDGWFSQDYSFTGSMVELEDHIVETWSVAIPFLREIMKDIGADLES